MYLQPNSRTFASLDADYSDWHKGRDQFSLWYLEIEDTACRDYLNTLQQQFQPFLYMPNYRQWHITLFVCGFWQAPFHLQHLSDHFHERQLQQQIDLLHQLQAESFELKLGGIRSYQSALFLDVIDEQNILLQLRRCFWPVAKEIDAMIYCPHVTLGLYRDEFPANEILQQMNQTQTQTWTVKFRHLTFGSYQARELQGELSAHYHFLLG
ncbi:2'-5' RNA ligase family protein [Acinetobacter sp. MB5]|uniref:2'-5' RNA ligase family protein n=1 Tax=Acinetobacter sp. MB5 TaxID=2069438 RepID=UPI000DD0A31E|nr:2'-5' RNA ligase family protein [Acinetobacter sp. MB5]